MTSGKQREIKGDGEIFKILDPEQTKEGKLIKLEQRRSLRKQHEELRESKFRHRKSQQAKPLLEQWLDDYWAINIETLNQKTKLEKKIYNLVNMLLELGDE